MTGGQGSMSKLKAGDTAMWATTTLMDLVGPYAQTTDCPLEKWFRDAKIYQLFEGTAQVQRLVISRMQRAEYQRRLEEAANGAGAGAGHAAGVSTTGRGAASPWTGGHGRARGVGHDAHEGFVSELRRVTPARRAVQAHGPAASGRAGRRAAPG